MASGWLAFSRKEFWVFDVCATHMSSMFHFETILALNLQPSRYPYLAEALPKEMKEEVLRGLTFLTPRPKKCTSDLLQNKCQFKSLDFLRDGSMDHKETTRMTYKSTLGWLLFDWEFRKVS